MHGFETELQQAQLRKLLPGFGASQPWHFVMRPGRGHALARMHVQMVCFAGDLIVVPHHCAHQVLNLEDTVAIAGNFVDQINWNDYLADQTLVSNRSDSQGKFAEAVLKFVASAGLQSISDISIQMPKEHTPLRELQLLWQNEHSRRGLKDS